MLFPTPSGATWHESDFRRGVWTPALVAHLGITRAEGETMRTFRARCGEELRLPRAIRPHDCRHSWVTHLRAERVDDADLAEMAGHTVDTMLDRYTHPLGRSHERVRALIG
ncbi:MAG TPA: tyrosine-type recombinase/integrase [Thermoleophilaceae bacterium]|nr:tyrosine-type recombinase/integrase [Thermoleophilaceae bacterium]